MRTVTLEDATRTKHLPDCIGYEDCTCFGSYWRHADIYKLQQATAAPHIDPASVFRRHGFHKSGKAEWYATSEAAFLRLCDDPERFIAGITCHGQTAEPGRWYAVVL